MDRVTHLLGGGAGLGTRQFDLGAYSLRDYLTIASAEAGMLFILEENLKKKREDAYLIAAR